MTNEVLDRAASYATCQMLQAAGTSLVGAGAWSIAMGGAGIVPITLGSLSLLAAGGLCQEMDAGPAQPNPKDGCQKMAEGGYGQIQYIVDDNWVAPSVPNPTQRDTAVEILMTTIGRDPQTLKYASQIEWASVSGGGAASTGAIFDTEGEAEAVGWRIDPIVGSCSTEPPPPPPPPEAYDPITYNDPVTNCTYNIQLLGFVQQVEGGTQDPVWLIEGATQLRASGGRIGGCNFSPTVYYQGPGGGGPPVPPFPYEPGDDPDGIPNWLRTLLSVLAGGAATIIVNEILQQLQNLFATEYPGLIYRMVSVCEKNEAGEPISQAVEVPIPALPAPAAQLARLDALVELLQAGKDFKQPTCDSGDTPPIPEDDFRTISFRSDETSPYGKSRLRKRFRYRSVSGNDLGAVVDHWKDFSFEGGPYRVRWIGGTWRSPEIWAASEAEGQRVIHHAAAEAGFSPLEGGRWSTRLSGSGRQGVPGTMRVDTKGGYYWITARDGSDQRPIVALT